MTRTDPVRHAILDDWFPDLDASRIYTEVPPPEWPHWVRYDNSDERKRTCRDLDKLGPETAKALRFFLSNEAVRQVCAWYDEELIADDTLHGGGLHVSGAGDFLGIHLDYARHPKRPEYERRVNLLYYAVPTWFDDWGGATVLTAPDGETVLSRCYPRKERVLLFETNDLSYHGTEKVTCPKEVERPTLAVYYLAPVRTGVTRQRALFVPSRGKH